MMGSTAGIVFQIASILLIVGAVFLFFRKNSSDDIPVTKVQKALAAFQIILCGGFFALCLSDILDLKMNASMERVIINIFYDLVFISLTAYALSDLGRKKRIHLQIVVYACAALIAVQCFIFPYGAESTIKRVFETAEGIITFLLLIILLIKTDNEKLAQTSLAIIVIMELAVAVLNTVIPMTAITGDTQSIDIPLNYASLYMRPVIFGSLALAYRVWLDRDRSESAVQ